MHTQKWHFFHGTTALTALVLLYLLTKENVTSFINNILCACRKVCARPARSIAAEHSSVSSFDKALLASATLKGYDGSATTPDGHPVAGVQRWWFFI